MNKKPNALIFSGYGLNCEEETQFGFEIAGARVDIVHINDVIDTRVKLSHYDILVFPGGFSYGDDTGSGKAYANRLNNHLGHELKTFLKRDTLMLGICNGFQILTQLGLLPGALVFNDSNRFINRWVDLEAKGESPWLTGITKLSLPVAHAEGKFVTDRKTLTKLKKQKNVAFRYTRGDMHRYRGLPENPNGALENIAGVLGYGGRVLGMMPHPDRALFSTQRPDWPLLKEKSRRSGETFPEYGPGLQIFRNGVEYFTK